MPVSPIIPAGYTEEPLNGARPPQAAAPPPPMQPAMQPSNLPDGYTEEPLPGVKQPAAQQTIQTEAPAATQTPHYVRDSLKSLMNMAQDADDWWDEQKVNAAKGAAKSGATTLSHILNMVRDNVYTGDIGDIPQYLQEHPGASVKEAHDAIMGIGPDGRPTAPYLGTQTLKNRKMLRDAADWLAQKGTMPAWSARGGTAQHVGGIAGDLLQWFGLEGAVGMMAKEAEVPAVLNQTLSTAQKFKRAAQFGDLAEQFPMLGKAATIGARVMHMVESGDPIAEQAMTGGAQSFIQSEGDPRETMKGALVAGGATAGARQASEMAADFLQKAGMPQAAEAAEAAGAGAGEATTGEMPPPKFTPPPEKPVKPEFTPTEVGPAPPAPEKLPPVEHPPAPERPEPIPRPAPPEPTPVPEEPVMGEGPAPTPLPEEPEYPGLYEADRAPIEQRLADMERQLSQGVISDSSTTAAQHLENLNDSVSLEDFKKLKPAQQADLLRQRRSLQQYVAKGINPPDSEDFINQAGDLSTAADMMRQPGEQARARWNELSGGQYETLASQLEKLEGKVDQASVAKRMDLEREIRRMFDDPKFQGGASVNRRALYRTMSQNADLVDDAGSVFDNSFKGAARSGEFNPTTFQSGWKSYVNKYGVERVKDVLGEERFNTMNDFVNQVAKEPEVDKAMQAAQDALYKSALNAHATQVAEIRAADKAAQEAHEADFDKVKDAWQEEKAKAAEMDKTAKANQTAEWQTARTKQAQDYKAAKADYDAGVDARNQERQQLLADRGREYQSKLDDWKQAKADAKNADAATRQQIDDTHKQALADWKAQSDQIRQLNLANKSEYARLKKAQDVTSDAQSSRVKDLLSQIKVPNGKLKTLLTLTAAATPVEILLHVASHGMGGKALVTGSAALTAWLLKRAIVNPTTGKLALQAIREGGRPEIYGPAISELLRSTTKEPQGFNAPEGEPQK